MAVSKLCKVTTRLERVIDYATNPEKTAKDIYSYEQYQALADVLKYAKDEEKTEREYFVEGINCNPSTARDQFITVKEQYDKMDGIQAYHGYLSFKEENISPELAQKIGMEFANKVWGERFQVVVTTHLNTKHLHCHFVVNSVSFVDGKRLANEEKAWFKFRHIADELCQKYGLYYNPNPNRSTQNSYYYKKDLAGMPTPYNNTRKAIDEAISCSRSLADFKYYLDQMGYKYQLSESRKYWTIVPKGWKKSIRLIKLGEEYSNERILERLKENRDKVTLLPFQKRTYLPREYTDRKKIGTLYGLYLHYCYLLGYFKKKQNTHRLHYLLRDDLMKLDKLTEQVRLLGKNHIDTSEQLFLYKSNLESEIQNLTSDRKQLQKEIRRKGITDAELSEKKARITAMTNRLKELRKEVRLCEQIAERSGVIRCNFETVIAEEEQLQRKEDRNYEQRR